MSTSKELMVLPPVQPHWLDERTKISEVDEHGNVIRIIYGMTRREELAAHRRHRCGFLCSFCYAEDCADALGIL